MSAIEIWEPQLNHIACMDAMEYAKRLPSESIHLQVFDPPYGIGHKSGWKTMNNRRQQRRTANQLDTPDVFDDSWLPEAYRTLHPDGTMYLFTQWQVLGQWKDSLEQVGYKVHQVIVWDKLSEGQGNLDVFGNQCEFILFCSKGNPYIDWSYYGKRNRSNVWGITKLSAINNEGNEDNPHQKPEELIRKIVLLSSKPGDVVGDFHCGSGTTAAVAHQTNRNFYACDVSHRQYVISRLRLKDRRSKPAQLELFTG